MVEILLVNEPILHDPKYSNKLLEKILSKKILGKISEIKSLKEELRSKQEEAEVLENELESVRREIKKLNKELQKINNNKNNFIIIGALTFLEGVALLFLMYYNVLGLVVGGISLFIGIGSLAYSSNLNNTLVELRRLIREKEGHLDRTKKKYIRVKTEIEELNKKIKEYKLPEIKIRKSKVYIPLLLKKTSDNRFIVILPWSKYKEIKMPLIVEEQYIEKGIEKLLEGEEIYVNSTIVEKDTGIKVIGSLREAGFWGRVAAAKAPEIILDDSVAEARSLIDNAIAESKAHIPFEELSEEDVRFLKEAVDVASPLRATLGQSENESLEEVLKKSETLSELLRTASKLESMKRYLSQAELFLEKKELYEEFAEKVLKKLLEETIPIDSDYYKAIHSMLLCKRCADRGVAEYRYAADFQEWVFNHVLAGVNRDPDILYPPPVIEDFVKNKWEALLKKTYYALKLPGVRENAELEELEKKYRQEVYKMTALLAGAHEEVVVQYTSPFTPPTLKCKRCGAEFSVGDAPRLRGLETSIYKGYLVLFNEFVDHFSDKTTTQRKSVADARRSKDERKTMAGIYEQTYHLYRIKQLEVESELKRSQMNLEELEKTLEPELRKKAIDIEMQGLKGVEKIGKILRKMLT